MSIYEIAEFTITPGESENFAAQVKESVPIFQAAEGCLGLRLERAVDVADRFLLVIDWETVEHHTKVFTTTDAFDAFVAAVSPLYAEDPRVYHTESLEIGF
jgi:quinol monooxygenase YgiN